MSGNIKEKFRDTLQYFFAKMLPNFLDYTVISGQNIYILGHHLHPYLLLLDIGTIAVFLFAYLFTYLFEGVVFYKFILIFLFVYLIYEKVFLKLKLWFLHTQVRSYLQDGLVFLFPSYLFGSWAMGMSLAASADLLGLMLPLLFGFVRIGCFLGGCCFGIPWRYGVIYPENLFNDVKGCRRYASDPNPGCRVLPIQLIEAFVNFSLFILLFLRLYTTKELSGDTLPLYLGCYGIYRIISDMFRKVSVRPRRGPFSEAQIVSFFVVLASLIYLLRGDI